MSRLCPPRLAIKVICGFFFARQTTPIRSSHRPSASSHGNRGPSPPSIMLFFFHSTVILLEAVDRTSGLAGLVPSHADPIGDVRHQPVRTMCYAAMMGHDYQPRPVEGTLWHWQPRPVEGTMWHWQPRPVEGTMWHWQPRPVEGTMWHWQPRPVEGTMPC